MEDLIKRKMGMIFAESRRSEIYERIFGPPEFNDEKTTHRILSPREGMDEFLENMERRKHAVRLTEDGNYIEVRDWDRPYNSFAYDIPMRECDNPIKMLGWALHMLEKTWITKDHVRLIIMAVCDKFGWRIFG